MAADQKVRYCAFLVYPESAPQDWKQRLKDSHGSYAISPLHEPAEEKPHYHVIYKHSGPARIEVLEKCIPGGIAANGYVEPVNSPRNYQRYLIHLDDPDKQQFEGGSNEIETINGFPLDLSRDYSKAELQGFRSQIFEAIRDNEMVEYSELLDYLMDSGEVDLLDYASNHTILFNTYLTSRRNASA